MIDRVSGRLSGTCCAGPAPAPSLLGGAAASPAPPSAGAGALAFEPDDDDALSCWAPPQPANANVATSTDASHHRVRLIVTVSSRVTWRMGVRCSNRRTRRARAAFRFGVSRFGVGTTPRRSHPDEGHQVLARLCT